MSETRKTIIFLGGAVVLVVLALLTAPRTVTPDAFLDQGEPFFPEFTDPNTARTLEVIAVDEETGEAKPFKVTFKDGKWSIPSHHDYPADGKDRLAQTAAGVIGIKKDDFRSDNVSDHELAGVVDPLDQTATGLKGRGKRVTIRGDNDVVLADFIIGNDIPDRENFRFVRVPGQKRVYAAKVDLDLSTTFSDWIESDLLLVEKDALEEVIISDYAINERTGKLVERDELVLRKDGDTWSANNMKENEQVDRGKMDQFLKALDELTIVGVRVKPDGLTAALSAAGGSRAIGQAEMLSLQSAGYFFTRDGRLVSNEGELKARSDDGVIYTLRFGEVVYGTGLEVTAGGGGASGAEAQGPGENRYLFITTEFDSAMFPEPPRPDNKDFLSKPDSMWTGEDYENRSLDNAHDQWEHTIDAGARRSQTLNERFARWYYVISSESFDKLRVTRSDILREKTS